MATQLQGCAGARVRGCVNGLGRQELPEAVALAASAPAHQRNPRLERQPERDRDDLERLAVGRDPAVADVQSRPQATEGELQPAADVEPPMILRIGLALAAHRCARLEAREARPRGQVWLDDAGRGYRKPGNDVRVEAKVREVGIDARSAEPLEVEGRVNDLAAKAERAQRDTEVERAADGVSGLHCVLRVADGQGCAREDGELQRVADLRPRGTQRGERDEREEHRGADLHFAFSRGWWLDGSDEPSLHDAPPARCATLRRSGRTSFEPCAVARYLPAGSSQRGDAPMAIFTPRPLGVPLFMIDRTLSTLSTRAITMALALASVAPPAAAQATRPSGIDTTNFDRSVRPQDYFFRFVNG